MTTLNDLAVQPDQIRAHILKDPSSVLEDQDIIQALVSARAKSEDRRVVDLRGVLLDRLEDRLERLEGTHRDVVAAAYENLAGTQQIHRAVLAILQARDFGSLFWALTDKVKSVLTLDDIRICVEADGLEVGMPLGPEGPYRNLLLGLPIGGAAAYCGQETLWPGKRVILRRTTAAAPLIYQEGAEALGSEAILKLEVGSGAVPMLLILGSNNPARFQPEQATDLLAFLALSFEAVMEQWLT